jgi:hypothetical protein
MRDMLSYAPVYTKAFAHKLEHDALISVFQLQKLATKRPVLWAMA